MFEFTYIHKNDFSEDISPFEKSLPAYKIFLEIQLETRQSRQQHKLTDSRANGADEEQNKCQLVLKLKTSTSTPLFLSAKLNKKLSECWLAGWLAGWFVGCLFV